jgi:hypothetical protein
MSSILAHPPEHVEARLQSDLEKGVLRAVEARVQRINYKTREMTIIAEGQVLYLTADPDCQCWFDDRQTILRSFHPLDQARVIFAPGEPNHVAKAMYAWER